MHRSSKKNSGNFKLNVQAKRQYALRNLDKYIKWSLENKGYLKFKDLVEQHNLYKVKVYESRI
jgi:hypothetical protein